MVSASPRLALTGRVHRDHVERAIDAHYIAPELYQGSRPPEGSVLRHLGFSLLVLCAMEHQPHRDRFPGVEVVHAPLDDDARPLTPGEWDIAREASRAAAVALLESQRVLVTCYSGFNRSGLVTALTLVRLSTRRGPRPEVIVKLVQRRRPGALFNPYFIDAVLSVERRCR